MLHPAKLHARRNCLCFQSKFHCPTGDLDSPAHPPAGWPPGGSDAVRCFQELMLSFLDSISIGGCSREASLSPRVKHPRHIGLTSCRTLCASAVKYSASSSVNRSPADATEADDACRASCTCRGVAACCSSTEVSTLYGSNQRLSWPLRTPRSWEY